MVVALLLANFNNSRIIPSMLGMKNASVNAASTPLVHRAGLTLQQCVQSSTSLLLSKALCVNPWNSVEDKNKPAETPPDVHLIVLIHGWLGNPKEMDGLKESLLEQSEIRLKQEMEDTEDAVNYHRVVVHSVTCNDGRTSDGIEAGGQRVAVEINQVVREIRNQDQANGRPNNSIQLSIVGNSLGGLYGRYAISEIDWTTTSTAENNGGENETDEKGKQPLIPHYFVTTATPHLGCGFQQTYLPLPRFMEHPIGNIMLRTGQDLFRLLNAESTHDRKVDILQEMTFSPTFINPLQKFRKRMAYANAHGTDFQVPLPTAAFWASTDSIHTLVEPKDDTENLIPKGVALTLTTPKVKEGEDAIIIEPKQEVATSEEISKRLDQLGWTKVLIDVRHEMPINLNPPPPEQKEEDEKKEESSSSIENNNNSDNNNKEASSLLKQEWTAKELLQEFDTGRLKSLPIGHMVMVANSKNEFYRNMCKSGIPIMDYLAREIINST